MNELNKIRGYLIQENISGQSANPVVSIKYFMMGLDNKLYLTSNLALIQFLCSNCETIETLYEASNKYLSRLRFLDTMTITEIRTYPQPEKLPFHNSKYFKISVKALSPKINDSLNISVAEGAKDINFFVFAFDDELIVGLHAFIVGYADMQKNPKKRSDFLSTKLELFKTEEETVSNETLTSKKHLENYKMKMKLLIKKMENDMHEIKEGTIVPPREVIEDDQETDKDKEASSKLVKLNNGSLYAGTLKGNRPEGNGKEFLPDGSSYVGEFRNGYWHGLGYLVDSENYICYGEFYEGRVVGI